MSTHTHTQGPWKAEGWGNLVVNSAEGYTITLAAGGKDACLDELKANARLIAAAPDLLANLKELIRYISDEFSASHALTHRANEAREAIAKAEGNA